MYLGSNTVADWLPDGTYSAILAQNFSSPKDLADHLISLDKDFRRYERHLQHKLSESYPITNNKLKSAVRLGWADDTSELLKKLECKVCESVLNGGIFNTEKVNEPVSVVNRQLAVAKRAVYNCSRPVSPVTKQINESNWWTQHWDEAPCHFKILNEVLQIKLTNLTEKEYNDKVFELYRKKDC